VKSKRPKRSAVAPEREEVPSAALALQLLGTWNRMSSGHVALSAGCSCGVAVSNVRVQDFEQDILEFLRGRHPVAVAAISIADLLSGLARTPDDLTRRLLDDLARSLGSFESQHSGR